MPDTPTITHCAVATDRGTWSAKCVPSPTTLSTSTEPRSRSIASRTTSSPTPRPERSVTTPRVENPARKMRRSASASFVASADSCESVLRSTACERIRFGIDAGAVVANLDEQRVASLRRPQDDGALERLPRALPLLGRLEAVVDRVAQQVGEGRPGSARSPIGRPRCRLPRRRGSPACRVRRRDRGSGGGTRRRPSRPAASAPGERRPGDRPRPARAGDRRSRAHGAGRRAASALPGCARVRRRAAPRAPRRRPAPARG